MKFTIPAIVLATGAAASPLAKGADGISVGAGATLTFQAGASLTCSTVTDGASSLKHVPTHSAHSTSYNITGIETYYSTSTRTLAPATHTVNSTVTKVDPSTEKYQPTSTATVFFTTVPLNMTIATITHTVSNHQYETTTRYVTGKDMTTTKSGFTPAASGLAASLSLLEALHASHSHTATHSISLPLTHSISLPITHSISYPATGSISLPAGKAHSTSSVSGTDSASSTGSASITAKATISIGAQASISAGAGGNTNSKREEAAAKKDKSKFPSEVQCTQIDIIPIKHTVTKKASKDATYQHTNTEVHKTTVTEHPVFTITELPKVVFTTQTVKATAGHTVTKTTTAYAGVKTVDYSLEACYPNNQLSYTINAATLAEVSIGSFNSGSKDAFEHVPKIDNAYLCCSACFTAGNCAGSYFADGQCYISTSTTCKAQAADVVGTFFSGKTGDKDAKSVTVSNGYCGSWAAGGL